MTDDQLAEAKRLAIVVRDTPWARLPASEPPRLARTTLDLIAEVERLRRERDEALADGVLSQRVCDLENENANLRTELERIRPVYEAAKAWRSQTTGMTTLNYVERPLAIAVDATEAKEP